MSQTIEYTSLPDGLVRPLIDVAIGDGSLVVKGLFDTGAMNTIFHSWVADEARIDLTGVPERTLGVGGHGLVTRFVPVTLSAAGHTWESSVGFADQWQEEWGLLGHHAFHRYFVALVRAADLLLTLTPIDT